MLYSVGKLIRVMIELHPWIFQLPISNLNNTCNSLVYMPEQSVQNQYQMSTEGDLMIRFCIQTFYES